VIQPFLDAIIANPGEDGPRLVFADYLEEQGECDRAELIRVQCKISAIQTECGGSDEFYKRLFHANHDCQCLTCVLVRREHELLGNHWTEWYTPFPASSTICRNLARWATLPLGAGSILFRRGFVDEIACPWEAWDRRGDSIARHHPVREVKLLTPPEIERGIHDLGGGYAVRGWAQFPSQNWRISVRPDQPTDTVIHLLLKERWPTISVFSFPARDLPRGATTDILDGRGWVMR